MAYYWLAGYNTLTLPEQIGGGGGCSAHGRATEGGDLQGVGDFIHILIYFPLPTHRQQGQRELYISRRQGGSYSLQ